MSAIRREAKHRDFKRAATVSASRVNPCLTFALRAQQKACAQFIASKNQRCDGCTIGPGDLVNIADLCQEHEYLNAFVSEIGEYFVSPHWFKQLGHTFKPGMIVVFDIEENGPVFKRIDVIFLQENGTLSLFLTSLECLGFDVHFDSYLVEKTHDGVCAPVRNLLNLHPTCHKEVERNCFLVNTRVAL